MSRAPLRAPLRSYLDDRLPEAQAHRLWRRIESGSSHPSIPVRRAWALALVASAVAVALVLLWDRRPLGPLRLEGGLDVPNHLATGPARHIELSDGSRLDVAEGARLDLLESSSRAFSVALRRGKVVFDVVPGGPRLFRVECGDVTVEVTGTRFTVERAAEFVFVGVERGSVIVRADAVPDHVVRLSAGDSVRVPARALTGEAASSPAEPPHSPEEAGGSREGRSIGDSDGRKVEAPPTPSAPRLSKSDPTNPPQASAASSTRVDGEPSSSPSGVSKAAFAPVPTDAPGKSLEAMLDDADSARRSRRYAEAAALLEQALAAHGSDPRASLAEFSLGRLYLDSLGNASLAAEHISRALERHLPEALAEDAQTRLVEALARAGNRVGAESAALRYHTLFPTGRRAADVDRWVYGAP